MSTTENFFERALIAIEDKFKTAETIEQQIAAWANSAVNTIKGLQSDKTVQFLETGLVAAAEAIDPALTPMISGIALALPKIISIIADGTAEVSKPAAQQLSDFITKLETIKGLDISVYAGLLATLSTAIQNYVTTNAGIIASPAQLNASALAIHATTA